MAKTIEVVLNSVAQTRKVAEELAHVLVLKKRKNDHALVIGLEGELGSGKTTFLQGFARGLQVSPALKSPTFVVMRSYKIRAPDSIYKRFIHIDAYRLETVKEINHLGWKNLIKDPYNVVAVEWFNNIKRVFPRSYTKVRLSHISKNKRQLQVQ